MNPPRTASGKGTGGLSAVCQTAGIVDERGTHRGGRWNGLSVFPEAVEVEGDRFPRERFDFLAAVAGDAEAGQVWQYAPQAPPSCSMTTKYSFIVSVLVDLPDGGYSLQCLSGTSLFDAPATVTLPGLVECVYWR